MVGEDAHISELVDFIFAARMAVNHEKNANAKGDQVFVCTVTFFCS